MLKIRIQAFAVGLLALLIGCASMGITQPKSLSDRVAYGYSTYTAVQYAAANAITAGELSSADGEQILKLADQSRVLLDAAKGMIATDPEGASTKLTLAVSILTQLQQYLRSKA